MNTQHELYSRGEIAKRSRVNSETIRYYEKIGIMPKPPRSEAGYRLYDGEHYQRLLFIRRSRELGFTLEEIRGLLDLVGEGEYTCAEVRDRTSEHLVEVEAKIRDLKRIQRSLKAMVATCSDGSMPDCPIVDFLTASPQTRPVSK